MDIQRQCVWCGKTYLAHGFGSRYCSTSCKNKAKRTKKKEEKNQFEAVAPKLPEVRNPSEKEFLTAKDVAYIFGINTATVYRYAAKGVFKALKLNGVKLVVHKSDLIIFSTMQLLTRRELMEDVVTRNTIPCVR